MRVPAIGAAVLIALALTMPAEGRHNPRAICVPIYEPGIGHGYFCAAPSQHRKRR